MSQGGTNMISTREKIGTLMKKFMKFIQEQRNQVIQVSVLINQACKIFKDNKKALDIIYYFEGLGLLMKISPEHLVFVGLRGMVRKLYEYENGQSIMNGGGSGNSGTSSNVGSNQQGQQNESVHGHHNILGPSNCQVGSLKQENSSLLQQLQIASGNNSTLNQLVSPSIVGSTSGSSGAKASSGIGLVGHRSQLLGGHLLGKMFYSLIYQREHGQTSKAAIQEMVEGFSLQQKEFSNKSFIVDVLNVLCALGLCEKNEATEVITYVGPDLNCYDATSHRKISSKFLEVLRREELVFGKDPAQISSSNPNPLGSNLSSNKSQLSKQLILKRVVSGQQPGIHTSPAHIQTELPMATHASYFPELFYGVLRSQNFQRHISTTVFFIGRTERKQSSSTNGGSLINESKPNTVSGISNKLYKVDLDIQHKSVSRQHAVIVYNFQVGRWEVRCLSRKNMIRIDSERYSWGDRNIWLRNKSELQIGPEKMVFLEASSPIENED